MKIKESIKLNASANAVWEILQDPGNMPAWSPKCCTCSGNKNIHIGSTFDATFELGRKTKTASCEVIELKPCERITIRYTGAAFSIKNGFVDETFQLNCQEPRKTQVKLEVDFTNSKLPFPIQCIMWFISTFGYKAGRSSLDGIKDLIE